jgi:hypothetical protein
MKGKIRALLFVLTLSILTNLTFIYQLTQAQHKMSNIVRNSTHYRDVINAANNIQNVCQQAKRAHQSAESMCEKAEKLCKKLRL